MFAVLEIAAVMMVVIALVPVLAHALELPGKRRLDRDAYRTVQAIYYPGFTAAGGIGEAGGFLVLLALLLSTDPGGSAFGLTLAALVLLAMSHATYWVFTHPVNKFWLQDEKLGRLGAGFFAVGGEGEDMKQRGRSDWTALRDRWETSHVIRAAFVLASLLALLVAVA